MEILDIVDEKGAPIGKTIERAIAHAEGIRHRTSHVWLLKRSPEGVQILLQKRSKNKDSFPGCYDISSAGHIPAGEDFVPSALRELREELGLAANPWELHYCGQRHLVWEQEFYGKPFKDNQVTNVYALWCHREPSEFILQEEEVEEVRWLDFEQCRDLVRENKIRHCIFMEELDMVYRYLERKASVLLRRIKKSDNRRMEQIVKDSLKEYGLDIPGTVYFDPQLEDLAGFYNSMENAGYWVLEVNDVVVGGVGVAFFAGNPQMGELQKLYIDKEHRGKGYSAFLLEHAICFAKERFPALYIETSTLLATANRIYPHYGFRQLDAPFAGTEHPAMNRWYLLVFA